MFGIRPMPRGFKRQIPNTNLQLPPMPRLYCDNAATSFPKAPGVAEAMLKYLTECGAAAGRGTYRSALEAQSIIDHCRLKVSRFFNAPPDRFIFTLNCTDSLNLAIRGLLKPGDHVVTTLLEHNSVLRPLAWLEQTLGITQTLLTPNQQGWIEPADLRAALRPNTRLVITTHASNVTGVIQPIDDLGTICREAGVLYLVDAAQTAGILPLDMSSQPVDILAMAGHKGLKGPLGTGLLYIRAGLDEEVSPWRLGGTGLASEELTPPATGPARFEAGNQNLPGIAGLSAALDWLAGQSLKEIQEREQFSRLGWQIALSTFPGIRLILPDSPSVNILSVTAEGFSPHDLAIIFEQEYGMEARPGLHCAPLCHQWLGTLPTGGTLRVSGESNQAK